MTENIKTELDTIVKTMVNTGLVSKIILFGSQAQGSGTQDSDIDLCALTNIKDRHPSDITVDLRMELYGIQKSPLDLFTYNQDEFPEHAKRATSFEHEIATSGVVL